MIAIKKISTNLIDFKVVCKSFHHCRDVFIVGEASRHLTLASHSNRDLHSDRRQAIVGNVGHLEHHVHGHAIILKEVADVLIQVVLLTLVDD